MNHPPIPPNCHALFEVDGVGWFRFRDDICAYHFQEPIHTLLKSNWRPIIAAVARCAWLDKFEKTCAAMQSMDAGTLDLIKAHRKAVSQRDNAVAWSKWGRGEKWE